MGVELQFVFLHDLEDLTQGLFMIFPMTVVDNDSVNVYQEAFEVSKEGFQEALEGRLCPHDTQWGLVPLELSLSGDGEGGVSRLLLGEVHLPHEVREVQGGEDLGLRDFDVLESFMDFLEFDRFRMVLPVESLEVLDNSVAIWMLEAEEWRVEHGVGFSD